PDPADPRPTGSFVALPGGPMAGRLGQYAQPGAGHGRTAPSAEPSPAAFPVRGRQPASGADPVPVGAAGPARSADSCRSRGLAGQPAQPPDPLPGPARAGAPGHLTRTEGEGRTRSPLPFISPRGTRRP